MRSGNRPEPGGRWSKDLAGWLQRISPSETQVLELFGDAAERRLKSLMERGYTLVGDVHPAEVGKVAGRLTPVPGGVGLLTVAMLMKNTVVAARRRRLSEW